MDQVIGATRRVIASLTSMTPQGFARARMPADEPLIVGDEIVAYDDIDETEAHATVREINGDIAYLDVDWSTYVDLDDEPEQTGDRLFSIDLVVGAASGTTTAFTAGKVARILRGGLVVEAVAERSMIRVRNLGGGLHRSVSFDVLPKAIVHDADVLQSIESAFGELTIHGSWSPSPVSGLMFECNHGGVGEPLRVRVDDDAAIRQR